MREFAKAFYLSPQWRRVRGYIFQRDAGLCVRCGRPGEIVHHRTPLTPANLGDPAIALGEDNLETLCRDCHTLAHIRSQPTAAGLAFDQDGNLVQRSVLRDAGEGNG